MSTEPPATAAPAAVRAPEPAAGRPAPAAPPARTRNELARLVADRRFWRGPGPWVLLLLVIANLVLPHVEPALGREASNDPNGRGALRLDPRTAGVPVRWDWSIGDNLETFLRYVPDARRQPVVVISGMSQMYTINDYHPGDQTVAEWMDDALAPRGVRVFGLAMPNLSHEEALLLLMAAASRPQTKPSTFIFAVAFEKLRETNVRPRAQEFLRGRPDLERQWEQVARGEAQRNPLASAKMLSTLNGLREPADRGGVEAELRNGIGTVVPVVRDRKTLNAVAFTNLMLLRNRAFGISNTTKRPIVPGLYNTNREFLAVMDDVARRNGIRLMLYVVPFNPSAENPYIPQEYAAFKTWLADFSRRRGIPLANLENAVPRPDWGVHFGGPDFKHFKGAGHRRTAEALVREFGPLLTAGAHPAATAAP